MHKTKIMAYKQNLKYCVVFSMKGEDEIKNSIIVRVIAVLILVSITLATTIASASTNAALCDENDGGEMVWREWATAWEVMETWTEQGKYNGRSATFLCIREERTCYTGYVCTANGSHRQIISKETQSRITRQFMGYN